MSRSDCFRLQTQSRVAHAALLNSLNKGIKGRVLLIQKTPEPKTACHPRCWAVYSHRHSKLSTTLFRFLRIFCDKILNTNHTPSNP